jgi:small subunit ribosomal protein S12e
MEVEQNNVESKELTKDNATKSVIQRALNVNGVLKGVSETLKALENNKVKLIFLADDCDDENYKNVLTLLAKEKKVPVVSVDTWENLKDFCKLGLPSSEIRRIAEDKGKDPKIKPRCSSASIIDFGEEDKESLDFLLSQN